MTSLTDIAIVGMAAHLPGADTVSDYWKNLCDGVESIRRLSPDELIANGESPSRMRARNYVPASVILKDFDHFDAEFFGLSQKEAAIMDPQHRQFLEVAWEALEDAGHTPEGFDGAVGVFAGCGMGSYFYFNICSNPDLVKNTGMFLLRHTGNDKDFLSTRVSHILDLKGPSLNIQTACSTSLVAVHIAAQSLLNGECDMALAGGVTIELPHGRGYTFEEGEILSPDGHCHAFDHRAQGTVFGSGAGCVVLRRLSDALRDGDHIWAVIKGTAVNNDGAAKAGYLAPSVDGQARAVAEAQAIAGVPADTVGYIECHGTGTYLGDPIEVAALTQAFRETTDKVDFARIGSVKTNIGHLDTAAGVASLIKASLAVHHGVIPPSLGFEAPNPAIDFDSSPFRVNDTLSALPALNGAPRRAGVNSLGVGGTNAHAVIEQPPEHAPSADADFPFVPLVLSAKSGKALDAAAARLADHLRKNPQQSLADVAWTLKTGRRAFDRKRIVVAETHAEAADLLTSNDRHRVFNHSALGQAPEVVFMFPGGGAQYAGMARDLYETEPVFRDWMERGLAHLAPKLDYDLKALWLPEPADMAAASATLKQPSVQLPLIMITEYALAQLWISWGVQPAVLIGHSMGENTAACLAGVIGFEDCIDLVHLRGTLFDTIAPGGMLSVPLSEAALRQVMGDSLDLASVNAPELCVVSGPKDQLDALARKLSADGIESQAIQIDIAAHSRMLEPILKRFGDFLRRVKLSPPQLPIISNRNGKILTADQATDPEYWVYHLRGSVLFSAGIETLSQSPNRVYLEVGPGKALSSLAQANGIPANQVLSSLRHPDQVIGDDLYFVGTLARLWALGCPVDWEPIWGAAPRRRVPLPTYPFQRSRYFIEPGQSAATPDLPLPEREADIADWGWEQHWRAKAADTNWDVEELAAAPKHNWLIFTDESGLARDVTARLRSAGHQVVTVQAGDRFARISDGAYVIAPEKGREDYDRLLQDLIGHGIAPDRIAHFWLVTQSETFRPGSSFFHRNLEQGFWSLTFLAQALAEENLPRPLHLTAFTTGAVALRRETLAYPEKSTLNGPIQVIPQEFPSITASALDLVIPAKSLREGLVDRVLEELIATPANGLYALRGERRYQRDIRKIALPPEMHVLPQGAAVLITGGFGGIGLTLAERLIRDYGAKIALLGREPLPPQAEWDKVLTADPAGRAVSRIRAVRQLEALGAQVITLAADVCNIEDMTKARAAAESAYGRIELLIHAAGHIEDAPILAKTPSQIEAVFGPKIHGTEVLERVFPDGSVGTIVVFASTSTVTGPAGQVDYVAANGFLNAWADSRAGGQTKVIALNWGIWSDIGMAAQAVTGKPPSPRTKTDAPMLTTAGFDDAGNRLYSAEWDVSEWWLDGHRTASGQVLIPGTGYLDLAAQALRHAGEPAQFEISDLYFFRPLAVSDTEPREIQVTLAPTDSGYRFETRSGVQVNGRQGLQLNAQANISFFDTPAPQLDLAAIAARMGPATKGNGMPSPQEAHLNFGPRWRVLSSQALGTNEGLAELALPAEFHADLQGHLIHPALMDIATGWGMALIQGYQPSHLWVPVSYQSLRVYGPLPAKIVSHMRNAADNRADAPSATFDITICDPQGQVVIAIEGFQLRKLDGALTIAAPDPREVEFTQTEDRALSPAEERLRHNLSQGIPAAQGAEAFLRALALGQSPVIVSSIPLPALIAQSQQPQTEAGASQSFERPDLESDYLAPRNDIERVLAGFWQDLLGVGQVGVEDSFFDLGGHSLIAVRLFAMIRKTYAVDFPISVLFEAPTIAACAAMIEERIGPQDQSDAPKAPTRRFTHLVPMHQGQSTGTPVFLVAGMFGNVLNLRHLAQLIGADRPFYGLQARGLYGDAEPHTSFADAARDYITEIRQVQPQGPYIIGGFSGGGLIAWEIARRLEAEGESIAQVILLDTPLPLRPELTRKDKALIKLAEFRRKGPAYAYEWWQARKAWAEQQAIAAPDAQDHQLHNASIERAFRAALPLYELTPRKGPVALFRPALDHHWKVSGGQWVSAAKEYVYDDNQWGPFAPDLEVIEVPGDHDSMVLEPNVRVLATRLRQLIDAAEAENAPEPQREAAE